ncbi:hypothetical protein C8Q77DRAFT_842297 [Trametes polyzona]|nr:hypothetical protein C8Q77DRAFT_842297 [Trametes polyzona]
MPRGLHPTARKADNDGRSPRRPGLVSCNIPSLPQERGSGRSEVPRALRYLPERFLRMRRCLQSGLQARVPPSLLVRRSIRAIAPAGTRMAADGDIRLHSRAARSQYRRATGGLASSTIVPSAATRHLHSPGTLARTLDILGGYQPNTSSPFADISSRTCPRVKRLSPGMRVAHGVPSIPSPLEVLSSQRSRNRDQDVRRRWHTRQYKLPKDLSECASRSSAANHSRPRTRRADAHRVSDLRTFPT